MPVPGGASCTHPDLTDLWEIVSIQVGGGDDTVTVEAPQQMVVSGDEGNDRISLRQAAVATAVGLDGDDTLIAAGSAILRGGDGNDHLSAGARSALSGDDGTDRLDGSPQDDVLINAGDRGARDVIACNGGKDVTQGDETDALEGCTPPAIDDIARVKFFGRSGSARGSACRRRCGCATGPSTASCRTRSRAAAARPATVRRSSTPGGRQRPADRQRRPTGAHQGPMVARRLPPAPKVHVGLEFRFGGVVLTKGFEFRTRARKLPTKRKRCTVTILDPSGVTGRERVVPCT